MVTGLKRVQTEQSILVNGKLGMHMAKAPSLIQMAGYMRAASSRALKKVSELKRGQTDASILVNGKMVKQMAKAPQIIQMALRMRAPTLRANE